MRSRLSKLNCACGGRIQGPLSFVSASFGGIPIAMGVAVFCENHRRLLDPVSGAPVKYTSRDLETDQVYLDENGYGEVRDENGGRVLGFWTSLAKEEKGKPIIVHSH